MSSNSVESSERQTRLKKKNIESKIDEVKSMNESKKKILTSAIKGMSVSATRDTLSEMRKLWEDRSTSSVFYPEPYSNFGLDYVKGVILKRHQKISE